MPSADGSACVDNSALSIPSCYVYRQLDATTYACKYCLGTHYLDDEGYCEDNSFVNNCLGYSAYNTCYVCILN